ncbi:protein LYRIC isoform X2 [Gouania willdenowi]|uniref:Protein LYRIC-like n=1 Tax=Gouania willdenowi TaxID=441366 RepID=A0A8C5N991_GOUWI|nr:protein LYRIC isoform X2 [Gouania willdenowi]
MERWQDEASQQARLLSDRLTQLLSSGLGWLRSELGVDVGLDPELIPPWLILTVAGTGLLLMVALWASLCRALTRRRPALSSENTAEECTRLAGRPVKAEEPKKKKKRSEKKVQPNGKAVSELQEEAIVHEEFVAQHQQLLTESKADKAAELKKSKKKAKQPVKPTKTVTTHGKEPEEGTWETKVSHKEKREQRKKDKGSSDGSGSPGGGNSPVNVPSEQPQPLAPPAPAGQKKKKEKGESTKMKAEKMEAVVPQINSEIADVAAAVTDIAVKPSAQMSGPKTGPWTTSRDPQSMWASGIDDSWTVIERGMPGTELNMVSLSGLALGTTDGGSADPGSDWNAPSEAWGNYEEPTPKAPPPQEQPTKVEPLIGADDNEDENGKGEASADGTAKTKKKKKKKKKTAEEGAAAQVDEKEPTPPPAPVKKPPPVQGNTAAVQPIKPAAVEMRAERPVKENKSQKPPVTQVPQKSTNDESTAKQTVNAAPTQQKPEDIQAPKPAKKKKARRET